MANCPKCETDRPEEDFHHPYEGRRHGYCKPCRRAYNRAWYRENRDRHIAQVRRNNERYLAKKRAYVDSIKAQPCQDCGGRFPPPAMDFDHVRGDKTAAISELIRRGASLSVIRREIEKCDLVCSNCHRIRTANRDWGRDY